VKIRRVLIAKVRDTAGVLNRFTGILSRRQLNIESISIGKSELCDLSQITVVIDVLDSREIEQVLKQLNRMIDVRCVKEILESSHVIREMALLKVNASAETRSEITSMIEPFHSNVIDLSRKTMTLQLTSTPDKIDAFIELLRPYGIKQLARTGLIGLGK